MEYFGLALQLGVLALEVFRDERGTKYSRLKNKLLKIEKEWQYEMALPDSSRSDLALDRLLFEARQVLEQVVAHGKSRK